MTWTCCGERFAHLREVVAGENIEYLNQHNAASRRRWCSDDLAAAIASGERRAVFDLIGCEVGRGDEAATHPDRGGELGGHGAFVEARGIGGDAGEGAGEFRLCEVVALFQKIAVALEDAARFGKMREVLCGGEVARLFLDKI